MSITSSSGRIDRRVTTSSMHINAPFPNLTTNEWEVPQSVSISVVTAYIGAFNNATSYQTFRSFLLSTKPGSTFLWGDFAETGITSLILEPAIHLIYFCIGDPIGSSTLTPTIWKNFQELVEYQRTNYASMGQTAPWVGEPSGASELGAKVPPGALVGGNLYVRNIYTSPSTNGGSWEPAPPAKVVIGMATVEGTTTPATGHLWGAFDSFSDVGVGQYKFVVSGINTTGTAVNFQATGMWMSTMTTSNHNLMGCEVKVYAEPAPSTDTAVEVWCKYGPSTTMYDFEKVWLTVSDASQAGPEVIY